jgi:hypothetical protein
MLQTHLVAYYNGASSLDRSAAVDAQLLRLRTAREKQCRLQRAKRHSV